MRDVDRGQADDLAGDATDDVWNVVSISGYFDPLKIAQCPQIVSFELAGLRSSLTDPDTHFSLDAPAGRRTLNQNKPLTTAHCSTGEIGIDEGLTGFKARR